MKPFSIDDIRDQFQSELQGCIAGTRENLDRYLTAEGSDADLDQARMLARTMTRVAIMVQAWGLAWLGEDLEILYGLAHSFHDSEPEGARNIVKLICGCIPQWQKLGELTLAGHFEEAITCYHLIRSKYEAIPSYFPSRRDAGKSKNAPGLKVVVQEFFSSKLLDIGFSLFKSGVSSRSGNQASQSEVVGASQAIDPVEDEAAEAIDTVESEAGGPGGAFTSPLQLPETEQTRSVDSVVDETQGVSFVDGSVHDACFGPINETEAVPSLLGINDPELPINAPPPPDSSIPEGSEVPSQIADLASAEEARDREGQGESPASASSYGDKAFQAQPKGERDLTVAQVFEEGYIALKQGQLEVALERFRLAVAMEPENRMLQHNLRVVEKKIASASGFSK